MFRLLSDLYNILQRSLYVKCVAEYKGMILFQSWSLFSDMTAVSNLENCLRSLPVVCLSHMHSTSGVSLHRRVHNSIKSFALFRRELEQPGAADRGRRSPPQLGRGESSGGYPAVFTHRNSWIFTDIFLGGQGEKVSRNCDACHSDICGHTCTFSRMKIWRNFSACFEAA